MTIMMNPLEYSQLVESIYQTVDQDDGVSALQDLLTARLQVPVDIQGYLSANLLLGEDKQDLQAYLHRQGIEELPARIIPHLERALTILGTRNEVRLLEQTLLRMLELLGCYLSLEDHRGEELTPLTLSNSTIDIDVVAAMTAPAELRLNGQEIKTIKLLRHTGHKYDLSAVQKLFPLNVTQSEGKLLAGLINGETIKSYADSNTVSEHTVKSQTKSILKKLSVGSQVELINHMYDKVLSPFLGIGDGQRLKVPSLLNNS